MNLKDRFNLKNNTTRVLHTEQNQAEKIGEKIISWLPHTPREYVVICVGTDRSTGDALGPLTGTFFSDMKPRHLTVYGTLHDPVHATNLKESIDKINKLHKNPFIIAIDACLGKTSSVGYLIASEGPLLPGAALKKPLPPVGDIHITGVVNVSGFMEYSVLQNTRLSIVVDMAHKIAAVLNILDQRLTYNNTMPAVVLPQLRETSI